ncbi:MAG: SH3 domain-containing protein [Gammaproteobacteria bacterium]|nr:SH3 domain-containing protein [Gammaproteobacteria bacterium]
MTLRVLLISGIVSCLFACSAQQHSTAPKTQLSDPKSQSSFYSNLEGMSEQKLQTSHWLQSPTQNKRVILSTEELLKITEQQFAQQRYLKSPLSYPDTLSGQKITSLIEKASTPSKYPRFYPDGTPLTEKEYQPYIDEMALDSVNSQQKVQFAVVVKRAPMRKFPTLDRVLNSGMDYDIDRFQETGAFPGENLAVLHVSRSGEWMFVQNYHYRAWIQSKYVALTSRQTLEQFSKKQHDDFLMVTGDKVFTTFDPYDKSISEVQLDMGVKLPHISHQEFEKFELNRHNPYTGYIVQLPTRTDDGRLQLKPALIARSADVAFEYLPYTEENIITQAFKFLGERYGWGHDFNGRDCTGFVGEIYKTFGLLMPRNSSQQGVAEYGQNQTFEKGTAVSEKLPYYNQLKVGDLLYLPGHVAMFLGYSNGQPYIIHDVHGLGYENSQGEKVSGILNGVSITPLLPFKSYLKSIYNIKSIR